jgi:ABC-type uncharacterized transport system ATPase subunit
MVHQHFMLVEAISPWSRTSCSAPSDSGLLDGQACRATVKEACAGVEARRTAFHVDPDALHRGPLGRPAAARRDLESAGHRGADILILDEPTGVLTPQGGGTICSCVLRNRLRGRGARPSSSITHKLKRDHGGHRCASRSCASGEMVATVRDGRDQPRSTSPNSWSADRVLLRCRSRGPATPGKMVLSVEGLVV